MFHITKFTLVIYTYILLTVHILELKVYSDPEQFYGRSKIGQYNKEKDRDPLAVIVVQMYRYCITLALKQARAMNTVCFIFIR